MSTTRTAKPGNSDRRPNRSPSRSLRWPALATCLSVSLILAGFILDRSPGTGRDLALLIGGPALTALLPASLVWLILAFVLHRRRRKTREGQRRLT